jgi:hypothetical protein
MSLPPGRLAVAKTVEGRKAALMRHLKKMTH